MIRSFRAITLVRATALLLLNDIAAGAQRLSVADSAMRLNRIGEWQQAAALTRARLAVTLDRDETCALTLQLLWAITRLGAIESGRTMLRTFDKDCARSLAARTAAETLAALRTEFADDRMSSGALLIPPNLPPLPETGVDVSAVDQFWRIADVLQSDKEPSVQLWQSMFATAGYRMAALTYPTLREDLEVALRPSYRERRDSLLQRRNTTTTRIEHFMNAVRDRDRLIVARDSAAQSVAAVIRDAIARAAKFLPGGTTEHTSPPLVAFVIAFDDAYSTGPHSVLVDLGFASSQSLLPILAHEFHHSYLAGLDRFSFVGNERARDVVIAAALHNLRNEGIADLIDKPYPFQSDALPAAYVVRYSATYARAPATLHLLDSLIANARGDTTAVRRLGSRIGGLLDPHPNGAFMARTIYETFGVDSLMPSVTNPFAFLRTYAAAEMYRGHALPFSPTTIAFLNDMEQRYVRP